ncbi:hypothetical protein CPC08DRAFT_650912, partial [Agrocybe pediades]
TGCLLCLAFLNWDDANVQASLISSNATYNKQQVSRIHFFPNFLYSGTYDPKLLWVGLLQGDLIVMAFKHVFLSPSSTQGGRERSHDSSRGTRSGNAQLYGMTSVTKKSIAYIATQVMFCLTSEATFHRTSSVIDPVKFYDSLLHYLYDSEYDVEVDGLLAWWNK